MSMHNPSMCFFCKKKKLWESHNLKTTIEKMDARTSTKIYAAMCFNCKHTCYNHFTLRNLHYATFGYKEMLQKLPCITDFISRTITENPPRFDVGDIVMGLSDNQYLCKICIKFVKMGSDGAIYGYESLGNRRTKDHFIKCHSKEQISECPSGCRDFFREREMERHKAECSFFCPVCKKKVADVKHFRNEHPDSDFQKCKYMGCTAVFRTYTGGKEDMEELNECTKHVMTYHVWQEMGENALNPLDINEKRD